MRKSRKANDEITAVSFGFQLYTLSLALSPVVPPGPTAIKGEGTEI
jgi:hypothetical protein